MGRTEDEAVVIAGELYLERRTAGCCIRCETFMGGAIYCHECRRGVSQQGYVYFVEQATADGPRVKIGFSANPRQRLRKYLTHAAYTSVVRLEMGGIHLERAYQREYANWNSKGEWYRVEGDVARHLSLPQTDPDEFIQLHSWFLSELDRRRRTAYGRKK